MVWPVVALGALAVGGAATGSIISAKKRQKEKKARKKQRRFRDRQFTRAVTSLADTRSQVNRQAGFTQQGATQEAVDRLGTGDSTIAQTQADEIDFQRRARVNALNRKAEQLSDARRTQNSLSRLQLEIQSLEVLQQQINAFLNAGLTGFAQVGGLTNPGGEQEKAEAGSI